tara:strand:- start:285 stop:1007 length:723 start_codon:yes stop_codon:yes gene_type:complete
MANITTKFVSSFSKLYCGPSVTTGASNTAQLRNIVEPHTESIDGALSSATTTSIVIHNAISTDLSTTGTLKFNNTAGVAQEIAYTNHNGSSKTFTIASTNFSGGNAVADDTAITIIGVHAAVNLVAEVGTISNEANIIDVPAFGDTYRQKLRGQLDAGQLDAVLYWAPRDVKHLELRQAATNGTTTYVTIAWSDDATGTSQEYVTFKAFVSSFGVDTTFDDVAKANVTFAIDGELYFFAG